MAPCSKILGEREGGIARLEEAAAAFREALKENTRERVPLDWAKTQINLGDALRTLGEREAGTARLEEAVGDFFEALKENTRERVPLEWAKTQTGLGNALRALGERDGGTAQLEPVAAIREALKETTRERAPFDWAKYPDQPRQCASNYRSARERNGSVGRGDRCLPEALRNSPATARHWTGLLPKPI